MEGEAKDLNKEVDGVTGQIALGPSPVGVLEDQPRVGGQLEITGLQLDELEATVLEQWEERCLAGGPDLLPGPAGV